MARINELEHSGSKIYFVVDDMGMPVSPGYPTLAEAEEAAEIMEASDGQAMLPAGVDVEAIAWAAEHAEGE